MSKGVTELFGEARRRLGVSQRKVTLPDFPRTGGTNRGPLLVLCSDRSGSPWLILLQTRCPAVLRRVPVGMPEAHEQSANLLAATARTRPSGGRGASTPACIPVRGWRQVLRRCAWRVFGERLLGEAAAVAFYALLAVFPALAVLISPDIQDNNYQSGETDVTGLVLSITVQRRIILGRHVAAELPVVFRQGPGTRVAAALGGHALLRPVRHAVFR
jgi:hypothetical protein